MKIEIDYYLSSITPETPVGAQTVTYRGQLICATGKTATEAREKLLAKVKVLSEIVLPKREIVELEEPEPEEELPAFVVEAMDIRDQGLHGGAGEDQENLSF